MISLLAKIPFVGSMLTAVIKRPRLLIEYAMIIVVVGLCVTTVNLWSKNNEFEKELQTARTQIETLRGNVAVLETQTEIQEEEILKLENARQADSSAMESLLRQLGNLKEKEEGIRGRINALEKTNETVSNFFAIPVPAELRRLPSNAPGTKGRYSY